MQQFTNDKLSVKRFESRDEMGRTAAADVSAVVRQLLERKSTVSMIFAAAPSQDDFLKYFSTDSEIDFSRIHAFHMDEYIGLDKDAPQGFGNYLKQHIFGKCPFRSVHYLSGQNPDPEAECRRYASVLPREGVDIVCLGIGENGHIAFNDPQNADLRDSQVVKVVKLDAVCRQQQVNDGCFQSLDEVPKMAMTLTVPTLRNAAYHFCIVPTERKAKAVYKMLHGAISADCPASVLRAAPHAVLYLDAESASLL